jgi:hypothetical protein
VLHPGDSWTYRRTDLRNNTSKEFTNLVEEVLPDRIRFRGGNFVTDLSQSVLLDRSRARDKMTESRFRPGLPMMLFPQRVGESKSGTITVIPAKAQRYEQRYELKILRKEKVSVPAGTFEAFLSERELGPRSRASGSDKAGLQQRMRIWYVPEVKRFVRFEIDEFDSSGNPVPVSRTELISFQLNP